MAVPLGKGRYYKLFAGSSPPKQLLIEDICEPGLLSDEYVQGLCEFVTANLSNLLLFRTQIFDGFSLFFFVE